MDDMPGTRPSLLVRLRDPKDERAWNEFTAIYGPLIYRLARRNGFQDADAADLVQEVLRAVAGAIDRWDPDSSKGPFRNWLFRIARNMMLNLVTNQRRHPRGTGRDDIRTLLESQPSPSTEDSELFELEYKRQVFRWAAEKVRGEFREADLGRLLANRGRRQKSPGGRRRPRHERRCRLHGQEPGRVSAPRSHRAGRNRVTAPEAWE